MINPSIKKLFPVLHILIWSIGIEIESPTFIIVSSILIIIVLALNNVDVIRDMKNIGKNIIMIAISFV